MKNITKTLCEFCVNAKFEEIPEDARKLILEGVKEGKAKSIRSRVEGVNNFVSEQYLHISKRRKSLFCRQSKNYTAHYSKFMS